MLQCKTALYGVQEVGLRLYNDPEHLRTLRVYDKTNKMYFKWGFVAWGAFVVGGFVCTPNIIVLGATIYCNIVRLATARTITMTSPPPSRCRKSARTHLTVMRDKRVQIHTFPYFPTAITFHVNHVTQHASKLSVYDY